MTVHDELDRIWKEAVVACFKVICRHLPEKTVGKTTTTTTKSAADIIVVPAEI
jgi:hypothetical protein